MAHQTTSSIDSTDSYSSIDSVESYHSTSHTRNTLRVMESEHPFESLERTAKKLIDNLAAKELDDYKQQLNRETITLKLHKVLKAMVEHAEECGGMNAKRYVAAAICVCVMSDDPVSEETLISLHHLAKTWFTHFLFIFYDNRSHRNQINFTPSSFATPTRDETASILDRNDKSRDADFKDQVGD
ncbi:hypothetical protein AX17_003667 [Amanita inopinata Kibby_2008]|nr:hypothetical protein AX17_003667 [Amanita inopinata Kibby_2008]